MLTTRILKEHEMFYTPRETNEKLKAHYNNIAKADDKLKYVQDNREALEKFDIKVDALINSYYNDYWEHKKEKYKGIN